MTLDQLPTWDKKGVLNVVVESPRGSQVKLKYDPELGAMKLSRPLPLGVVFPCEFGFIPRTRAADGDPLDAVVLLDVPTFPGVVLQCRPIAIVRISQKGNGDRARNDRVVCIPIEDRRRSHVNEASDLSKREREELDAFFEAAAALEGKDLELLGWADARAAHAAIESARSR